MSWINQEPTKLNSQLDMEVAIETITPERAQEMLKHNTGNRRLKPSTVTMYATEMKEGRWQPNGDTICFNGTKLLDGQHRLSGIVESGTTQDMIVVRGLPDSAQDTMDEGSVRTKGDVLGIAGEKNCNRLAALLGFIYGYKTKDQHCYHSRVQNHRIKEILSSHPDARSVPGMVPRTSLCPQRLIDGCYYLFREKDSEMANTYIQGIIEGVGLTHGDPALTVRNKLIEVSSSPVKKMSSRDTVVLLIKGWNAFRRGKKATQFRLRDKMEMPSIT